MDELAGKLFAVDMSTNNAVISGSFVRRGVWRFSLGITIVSIIDTGTYRLRATCNPNAPNKWDLRHSSVKPAVSSERSKPGMVTKRRIEGAR